jgi:hypothetical protein
MEFDQLVICSILEMPFRGDGLITPRPGITSVRFITSFLKMNSHNSLFAVGTQYIGFLKKTPMVPKNWVRINTMATSIAANFSITASGQATTGPRVQTKRRRRITPQAGHALEILGHAIEYLTDEFVHEGATLTSGNSQLQAVQMLMALNRQVYFECAEVPTLAERLRAAFHLSAA